MDGKSTMRDELMKLCTDFIKLTDCSLDNGIVSKLEYDQLIKNKVIFIQETSAQYVNCFMDENVCCPK